MIVAALLTRWRHPHLRSALRIPQAGDEIVVVCRGGVNRNRRPIDHEFLQRFHVPARA
jgi:hypothetical protein